MKLSNVAMISEAENKINYREFHALRVISTCCSAFLSWKHFLDCYLRITTHRTLIFYITV